MKTHQTKQKTIKVFTKNETYYLLTVKLYQNLFNATGKLTIIGKSPLTSFKDEIILNDVRNWVSDLSKWVEDEKFALKFTSFAEAHDYERNEAIIAKFLGLGK